MNREHAIDVIRTELSKQRAQGVKPLDLSPSGGDPDTVYIEGVLDLHKLAVAIEDATRWE